MIVVRLGPEGVRTAEVVASSDHDEDRDLVLWPLVREELNRLDERLRREAPGILDRLKPSGGAA